MEAPAPARVLVVGDVMTDVIVRPEGPLVRGSDRRATVRTVPGGSGANQAAWLGRFGVPVAFAARVGADDHDACAAALRREGVDPRLAADDRRPTGCLVTIVDPDGERSFLTDRGANDALCTGDLPDALLDGIALLHVSGYALFTAGPRGAVRGLMARARARGIAVSVDPASISFLAEVGPAAFLDWTHGADLCFPNDAEAALLAGTADRPGQRSLLRARYGCVVIKRGAEGAEVVGDGVLSRPAPAVRAVDTTGAGDAFMAGFVAARLAGASDEAALRRAVAAGSDAVTVVGGRPRS